MNHELEPISPPEAVESYLAQRETELAEATLRSQRSRLSYFLEWCEEEGFSNLNDLSGRNLHQYRLWRRDEGNLAPPSEKSQMDTVRVFIRWAESIDAVQTDLSTKVVSPKISKGEHVRDVMVEVEDAGSTLEHLRRYEYASERHVTFRLMWRAGLRRGSIVALDIGDYDSQEQALDITHRPETGTPLKNQMAGERFVALTDATCDILDAWLEDQRPSVTDEQGREPLMATAQGRVHPTTIQNYIYSVTKPCFSGGCPHDREIEECVAAGDRSQAFRCPSSISPHGIRRGAITHWLSEDVPEPVVSDRANVSPEILKEHYDGRSKREKMEQRRGYLDNI